MQRANSFQSSSTGIGMNLLSAFLSLVLNGWNGWDGMEEMEWMEWMVVVV